MSGRGDAYVPFEPSGSAPAGIHGADPIGGLVPRRDPELLQDRGDLVVHGPHGHDEPVGDLGVGQAVGQQVEDLGLAERQPGRVMSGGRLRPRGIERERGLRASMLAGAAAWGLSAAAVAVAAPMAVQLATVGVAGAVSSPVVFAPRAALPALVATDTLGRASGLEAASYEVALLVAPVVAAPLGRRGAAVVLLAGLLGVSGGLLEPALAAAPAAVTLSAVLASDAAPFVVLGSSSLVGGLIAARLIGRRRIGTACRCSRCTRSAWRSLVVSAASPGWWRWRWLGWPSLRSPVSRDATSTRASLSIVRPRRWRWRLLRWSLAPASDRPPPQRCSTAHAPRRASSPSPQAQAASPPASSPSAGDPNHRLRGRSTDRGAPSRAPPCISRACP